MGQPPLEPGDDVGPVRPAGGGSPSDVNRNSVMRRALADIRRTITLEVFARDRHFLEYSRDRLRELWAAAA